VVRLPSLGPRGEGWVLLQVVLIVLVAAAAWSLGPDWSGPLRVAGVAVGVSLIAVGLSLIVRGAIDLGGAMTPVPRPRAGAELVETGVYGRVRHPIYGGLIFAAFGAALVQASLVAVASSACLAVVLRLKSGLEERWLDARYPGYAAYRARTPRFIPRIRSTPDHP
jgi:protein-S-isoprenylcysteine O-methyltransferase Ste14